MITSSMMICAERVIRDIQTNQISVINILEEMTPEGLPIFIQRLMIFAFLHREIKVDPEKITCIFRISTGSQKLFEHELDVHFQDKATNRSIVDIGGLVVPVTGVVEISLLLEETLLNKYSFRVNEPRQASKKQQPG